MAIENRDIQYKQPNEFPSHVWRTAMSVYGQMKEFGQPLNGNELMVRAFAEQIEAGKPVSFVGFWGVGDKEHPDALDRGFMDQLDELRKKVANVYPQGAEIAVILADLHGVFNGHIEEGAIQVFPEPSIPYLQQIRQELERRSMSSIWLSSLYKQFNLSLPDITEPIDEQSEAYAVLVDPQRAKGYLYSARHNRRGVEARTAAYHYIRERLAEKNMLVHGFPGATLFVNGGRNLAKPLVPEGRMPILYVHEGPVWFQRENGGGGELL